MGGKENEGKQGWKWWDMRGGCHGNAGNGCHAKALGRHLWEARSLNLHVCGYSALLAIRSASCGTCGSSIQAFSIIRLILCL
ncbi:hypothetical protein M758_9G010900 [Ceratodon purpureus]|nr:hypothetical protein M758_9G010900 [Ceratodon purpureus]